MAQLQKEKKILSPYHNSSVCKYQARIFFFWTHVLICMCAHVCESQRSTSGITSHVLSTLFFGGGDVFPLGWASLIRQGWLTSKLQGFSCLYLLSNETTSVHHPIWLFTWALRPELRSSCL